MDHNPKVIIALLVLPLGGCDWEVPTAILIGFALMIVLVRRLVGVERRAKARREWLLTRGKRVRAQLDDLTVRATMPHHHVAIVGFTLTFEHQGKPTTEVHKQAVPQVKLARMTIGDKIPIGYDPDNPSELTIDVDSI